MFDFPMYTFRQIEQKVEIINYSIPVKPSYAHAKKTKKIEYIQMFENLSCACVWSCVGWTSEFKFKFGQIKILTTVELYLTEDTHKSI